MDAEKGGWTYRDLCLEARRLLEYLPKHQKSVRSSSNFETSNSTGVRSVIEYSHVYCEHDCSTGETEKSGGACPVGPNICPDSVPRLALHCESYRAQKLKVWSYLTRACSLRADRGFVGATTPCGVYAPHHNVYLVPVIRNHFYEMSAGRETGRAASNKQWQGSLTPPVESSTAAAISQTR